MVWSSPLDDVRAGDRLWSAYLKNVLFWNKIALVSRVMAGNITKQLQTSLPLLDHLTKYFDWKNLVFIRRVGRRIGRGVGSGSAARWLWYLVRVHNQLCFGTDLCCIKNLTSTTGQSRRSVSKYERRTERKGWLRGWRGQINRNKLLRIKFQFNHFFSGTWLLRSFCRWSVINIKRVYFATS